MFNDDFAMLDCRLRQLEGVVDRFVAVEANMSFSGIEKPYYLTEAQDRYALTPLDIVQVDLSNVPKIGSYGAWVTPGTEPCWDREGAQRNGATEIVNDYPPDTIVLYGDIDEIPRPNIITTFDNRAPSTMQMTHLLYSTHWQYPAPWYGTVIGVRRDLKTALSLRDRRWYLPQIKNSGWHLSWFGSSDDRVRKLHQHSHQELQTTVGQAVGDQLPAARRHMDGTELTPYSGDLPKWISEGHAPADWTADW